MNPCTHDRDTYTNKNTEAFNHCPECRGRICLRCRNRAEESWSSGLCNGCYRIAQTENREREAKWAEESRLRGLAEAWEQGAAAIASLKPGYEVRNPYTERLKALT